MSDFEVHDNAAQHRFELIDDGQIGALATYRLRDDTVIVLHTETDPDKRGRGLAGELARQALDQLRARGQRIVPACPFFGKYIAEHPEYADLVAR